MYNSQFNKRTNFELTLYGRSNANCRPATTSRLAGARKLFSVLASMPTSNDTLCSGPTLKALVLKISLKPNVLRNRPYISVAPAQSAGTPKMVPAFVHGEAGSLWPDLNKEMVKKLVP